MNESFFINKGAELSPCRQYRFSLWRIWGEGNIAIFIGLNPSTADEDVDDPTIRRCIGFAKKWGFDGIVMLNIFAYRATSPKRLKACKLPIGHNNSDYMLRAMEKYNGKIICAWGGHGTFRGRGDRVVDYFKGKGFQLYCLGKTKQGQPKHPLYLRKDTELEVL
jgi:hypothetical protein